MDNLSSRKLPKSVTISILTLATAAVWVFFEVYRIITTKPAPTVPPEILAPINPALDQKSLEELPGRIYFENIESYSPDK